MLFHPSADTDTSILTFPASFAGIQKDSLLRGVELIDYNEGRSYFLRLYFVTLRGTRFKIRYFPKRRD